MVEKNPVVARALKSNIEKLAVANIFVRAQDGLEFALRDTQRYDVIFLDPPFASDYLPRLLEILPPRLNENGVLYVESGQVLDAPPGWQVIKSGRAGQVHFQLMGLAE